MATNAQELFGDILECPVCLRMYDEKERKPKCLECQHCVCLSDLIKIVAAGNGVKCPICRQASRYVPGTAVDEAFRDHLVTKKLLNRNLMINPAQIMKAKRVSLKKLESELGKVEKQERESAEKVFAATEVWRNDQKQERESAQKAFAATDVWRSDQKQMKKLRDEVESTKADINAWELGVGIKLSNSEADDDIPSKDEREYDGREMREIIRAGTLNGPCYLASLDEENTFIVSNANAGRLLIFSLDGQVLARIGKQGTGPGEFSDPQGIAVQDGNIYVADYGNKRIQVINRYGGFIKEIRLDVKPCQIIFVKSEIENCAYVVYCKGLIVFDHKWNEIRRIVMNNFQLLFDVCYYQGLLYAVDNKAHVIHVISPLGGYVKCLREGELHGPASIVVDKKGNFIVGEFNSKRVTVLSQEGKLVCRLGEGTLGSVSGICLTQNKDILVCDSNNAKIVKF